MLLFKDMFNRFLLSCGLVGLPEVLYGNMEHIYTREEENLHTFIQHLIYTGVDIAGG